MFGNSLENLGKSTREGKNKHSNKFPRFLKIFGNLQSLWKSSEKIAECRKVLKTTFQQFLKLIRKLSEVFGCLKRSLENFGNCRKMLKTTFQHL